MLDLWKRQPARLVGFASAVISLVIAFGFEVTSGQSVAILGVISAALFLVGGESIARTVYSPATVENEYVKKEPLANANENAQEWE